jgi:hypothetical protein
MKWQYLVASVAATAIAGSASAATMVAGWNFSQYAGDGSLDTDNDFVNEDTLSANFSNQVSGDGAGVEANPFGTMYMNGQHGSTNIDEDGFPPAFGPSQATGGSLTQNEAAPQTGTPPGAITFNGPCSAQNGQANCQELAMVANGSVNIVFQATLASAGLLGQDWSVTFGGRTLGGNSDVTIEFSLDGLVYTNLSSEQLGTSEETVSRSFAAVPDDLVSTAYIRLGFNSLFGSEAVIDNLAIAVAETQPIPEPGTAMLLGMGLLGLGMSGRCRKA